MSENKMEEKMEFLEMKRAIVEVEGMVFPKLFEVNVKRPMEEHIGCVRKMDMRHDDVILCAYTKSGTHWIWEVCSMLMSGKAEYDKRTKEHVMMEATDVEVLQQMPSPRIFNTHFPPRMLPNEVKVEKKVKVIHVYRNPKDVLVSFWFQIVKSIHAGVKDDAPLQEAMDMFLSEKCVGGNYILFLKEMDAFINDNPDIPIFNMSFEQMKADPAGTVEKLAQFLKVDASAQLCANIAEACSFKKMKQADIDCKELPEHFKKFPGMNKLYRKGEVGDWKNHLTVAQNEIVDSAMKQLESCSNFQFKYTL